MLLIIPAITIKDGKCVGKITYPQSIEGLSYEKPEDRVRLLRKENAKALHLIFEGDSFWSQETLELIERIRQAVDIPIEVSLPAIPNVSSELRQLIQSGIYRLFLPHNADDFFLSHCVNDFTCQKIVVSIGIEEATKEKLIQLKKDGLARVCITLPSHNKLFPLEQLQRIAELAKATGLRLSLLFGVYSYYTLIELARLEPGFDSVILGEVLEHNSFPCQMIWRQVESKAFEIGNAEANLWKNPLEHVPHI